ncbi:MAG TPA: PIG-L family deacetylase [Candidatus Saccharimonadales bacterium]|nr:PIG-L family deacetylase [Candidatus Saccharimonadales bacterium]
MVLLGTTVLWAVIGARLQAHNADQLSDPYLFSSWATFHGASFPGAHTFLLKWPIFWLLHVFGVSPTTLTVATVAVVLLTVGALVAVLYFVIRRPLVFGTVCLALALALLLVPAQPYAGGILPVNMAMLTTRNLEYAVYLAVLVLFVRANGMRNRSFVLGTALLTLLIASDKLFMSLSAGGALLALLVYALLSNWGMSVFAVRWLAGSVIATVAAIVALWTVVVTQLTHLAGGSGGASPYGLAHGLKDLLLGVAYTVAGLFTNVGANPAYDNTILKELPGSLVHRLWHWQALTYLVAATVLGFALVAVWRVVRPTLAPAHDHIRPANAHLVSLALVASTLAAIALFVLTDHYYAVDARYLTISLFALAVTAGVYLRTHETYRPEQVLLAACVLLAAGTLAVPTAIRVSDHQAAAYNIIAGRNSLISTALQRHKVDVLVGDYWRVLPIKLSGHGQPTVMPLVTCTQPSGALTSHEWQPDLTKHSFAYLVTLDGSLTGFPTCSLDKITAAYGRPNATQVIAGTIAQPKEALLFYDGGSHPGAIESPIQLANSLLPISPDQLTKTSCTRPTVMNVVAHEDDDLLFLSPDLLHEVRAGNCIRTVYLTAGDSGLGKLYWLSRQLGAEAAYGNMLGVKDAVWDQQSVELAPGQYATVATLHRQSRVSLVFLNLPDGNLKGQGFAASGHESLEKLFGGKIKTLHTVDGQSGYTSQQLVDTLSLLMDIYQPAEIHTQADVASDRYPDHSDHMATGNITELAAAQYDQQHFGDVVSIPVTRYIGYPIHEYEPNVAGEDLGTKESAFYAYGQYDGGTCRDLLQCEGTNYILYLQRQYTQ